MSADAKYLQVRQLAAEWRQDPATIYRKIRRGEIPAVRLGSGHSALRIPVDELARCFSSTKPPADGAADSLLPGSPHSGAEREEP